MRNFYPARPPDPSRPEGAGGVVAFEVLDRWEKVLATLESDPASLVGVLDWVTKWRILEGYRERYGLLSGDIRLRALDLQYHDLRPERSLFRRLGCETIVPRFDIESAIDSPPEGTRAYFRGRCLERWPESIVAANWDSLLVDTGGKTLRRIPMMEPTRGTRVHVDTLINECDDVAELLDRLSSEKD